MKSTIFCRGSADNCVLRDSVTIGKGNKLFLRNQDLAE
jgi:hypothetical protein